MNIKKLRKRYFAYNRKQRRKQYISANKELRREIGKESKKGKLCVHFGGRFNYEYAVAARLFFRKNKDFYVRVRLEETGWNNEFMATEILISWDINDKPMYDEAIVFHIDSEVEDLIQIKTDMNQKAKDYIKSNTLDLESNNRMDSTGYVQYAVSIAKAYGAIAIAEEEVKQKAISAFDAACSYCGQIHYCFDCSFRKDFIKNLNRD